MTDKIKNNVLSLLIILDAVAREAGTIFTGKARKVYLSTDDLDASWQDNISREKAEVDTLSPGYTEKAEWITAPAVFMAAAKEGAIGVDTDASAVIMDLSTKATVVATKDGAVVDGADPDTRYIFADLTRKQQSMGPIEDSILVVAYTDGYFTILVPKQDSDLLAKIHMLGEAGSALSSTVITFFAADIEGRRGEAVRPIVDAEVFKSNRLYLTLNDFIAHGVDALKAKEVASEKKAEKKAIIEEHTLKAQDAIANVMEYVVSEGDAAFQVQNASSGEFDIIDRDILTKHIEATMTPSRAVYHQSSLVPAGRYNLGTVRKIIDNARNNDLTPSNSTEG